MYQKLKPLGGYTLHVFRDPDYIFTDFELRAKNGVRIEHSAVSSVINSGYDADLLHQVLETLGANIIELAFDECGANLGLRAVWRFSDKPLLGYTVETTEHLHAYIDEEFGPGGHTEYRIRVLNKWGREIPIEILERDEDTGMSHCLDKLLEFLGANNVSLTEYH